MKKHTRIGFLVFWIIATPIYFMFAVYFVDVNVPLALVYIFLTLASAFMAWDNYLDIPNK